LAGWRGYCLQEGPHICTETTMRLHHLFVLGTLALAPGTALAVPAYTVTDLGPGRSFSDINARGQMTGSYGTADGSQHAFLWDPVAGLRDLGTLGGSTSRGEAINANGQVTGYSATLGRTRK
jgi:probable HAF family extracellular repeat protein